MGSTTTVESSPSSPSAGAAAAEIESTSTPPPSSESEHPSASNPIVDDENENTNTNNSKDDGITTRVWATPYIVAIVFFLAFLLFWMYYAILQRYWIQNTWNDSLPGLDTTSLHKFTMRMHMTTGAIGMLLGPIQFVPYIRKKHRTIHRYTGRIYCTCGMLACFFGEWFILLKKGRLVGGYNMSIAFAIAGFAIGYSSFQTWKTARNAKYSCSSSSSTITTVQQQQQQRYDFQTHRNWAIRSYAQMIAPALYRYWYILVEMFHIYNTPTPVRNGGYCDKDNFCPDYARPFDAIYCWLYWISAGIVAEIIVYYLPDIHVKEQQIYLTPYVVGEGGEGSSVDDGSDPTMVAPLLTTDSRIVETTTSSNGNDPTQPSSSSTAVGPSYGSNETTTTTNLDAVPASSTTTRDDDKHHHSSAMIVNLVGIFLAVVTITITGKIFYVVFTRE